MRQRTTRRWPGIVSLIAAIAIAGCSSSGDAPPAPTATPTAIETTELNPNEGHDHSADGAGDHTASDPEAEVYEQVTENGVSVEFTVRSFAGVGGRGGEIVAQIPAGSSASAVLRITDEATAAPLAGTAPLAWLDRVTDDDVRGCSERVEGYISGALTARPLIDLNSFFVLALNGDPTISVIDPSISVGGYTQLFSAMILSGPGHDWALSPDHGTLVITIPSKGQLAVADVEAFVLLNHVPVGENPARVAIAPDGRTAWVGNDADGEAGGVTVVDLGDRHALGHVATGGGRHEIAFSADGALAYVTNSAERSVSVIDARSLGVRSEIAVGGEPTGIAVSASGDVYVATAGGEGIVVLDGETGALSGRIPAAREVTALRFAPGGRWAFAASPASDRVFIIDADERIVRYAVPVEGGPRDLSFTEHSAYVSAEHSPGITAIPLDQIGVQDTFPVTVISGGSAAPEALTGGAVASRIFSTPQSGALLVASPGDDQVFYLPEGANASSGAFQGHGLRPRAVVVVDRSLRETSTGVFTGKFRAPEPGTYRLAMLLPEPRVVQCFDFEVQAAEEQGGAGPVAGRPDLEFLDEGAIVMAPNEPRTVRFRLTDAASGEPLAADDAVTMLAQISANWSAEFPARHVGDGVYEVEVTAPLAGIYQVLVGVPSLQVDFAAFAPRAVRVE